MDPVVRYLLDRKRKNGAVNSPATRRTQGRRQVDIRPRTLGEILDDSWRLALADLPLLLLFNALFLVPAFIVLMLLLAEPVPLGIFQLVLPTLAALSLPLMGLASGACQELLRRRAEGERVGARNCLMRSLRYGLEHAAAHAIVLCITLPGPFLLIISFLPDTSPIVRFLGFLFGLMLTFLLSLPIWSGCFSLHALLSRDRSRSGTLMSELRRDVAATPGRAVVLVLIRIALLFFLALQLHLLAKVILWITDNLGGFDTTLLEIQLALFSNPLYTLALFFLSWLLLSPFFECGNFLLHTDIRTRQEGLDLQFRVQRAFTGLAGVKEDGKNRRDAKDAKKKIGTRTNSTSDRLLLWLFLGGLGVLAVFSQPTVTAARADEAKSEKLHVVRQEIETIRSEIQKAEPYPSGQLWQSRLRGLTAKLAQIDGGDLRRFRWFEQAIADFQDRKKEDALSILDDLLRRLALFEDSLTATDQPAAQARDKRSAEDIKSLLRGSEGRKVERNRTRPRVEEDRPQVRREEPGGKEPDAEAPRGGGGRGNPVSVPAAKSGGLSSLGWWLLGGLTLAIVAVGLFLYWTSPHSPKRERAEPATSAAGLTQDKDTQQVLEESPAALWRHADALASSGSFREAVRALYLAVLAHLHRQQLIRFEPTRTNGEYVRQVRFSEQAPPELHESFQRLTNLFETAWYGERPCESGDYRSCRDLGEEVQRSTNHA
jgi:hypothetical protein